MRPGASNAHKLSNFDKQPKIENNLSTAVTVTVTVTVTGTVTITVTVTVKVKVKNTVKV